MDVLKGVVKWFDDKKGYGFIDVLGVDYFVHYRVIKMDGFRTLREGQEVTFLAEKGQKGNLAKDVFLLSD